MGGGEEKKMRDVIQRKGKEKNKQIERKIEYMTRIVWTIWHHPQIERIERPGLQVRA